MMDEATRKSIKDTVTGGTTLYGVLECLSADGSAATMSLPADGRITATLDPGLSGILSGLLGRTVGLHGTATWRLPDWAVVGFHATEDTGYRPHETNVEEGFAALARFGPFRWDEIGVEAFMREIRDDDEPEAPR